MMTRRSTGWAALVRSVLLAGAALAVPAAAAAAEDAAVQAQGVADDPAATGNDIVVTATKREQTLQEIPVAVTVTSAQTLERAQIRDLKDLQSVVPSLRVNQLQSSANTNFYIRGFGNGANNAGIEPSVGLFIDGVYRSRSAAMIADFPDVERIEVLRGPQSTLFGKNASAGVISIVTMKPKFEFGGNVEATYGNFDAIILKGVVTGPLADTVAVSLAGAVNSRDGYVRNLVTGRRANDRDRWFLRGQLLFQPQEDLSVRLIGDYGKINEICCAAVNLRPSLTPALGGPPGGGATVAIQALGGRVNPAATPFADIVYYNLDSTNRIENWGGSAEIDYDAGGARLVSITSYRRTNALTNQDSDFSSADLLGRNFQDLRIRTFTQELRLTGDITDRLSGLLGAYFYSERIAQANQVLLGTQFRPYADILIQGQSNGAFTLPAVEQLLGALQGNPALYAGRFFGAGQGLTEAYRLKNDAFSAFAQLDFEVADGLVFTGGVNYTHDRKRFATNVTSTDVFSGVPLANFVTPATNLFIAQTVGRLLSVPGGIASVAQVGGFAAANPAAFAQIQTGSAATAQQLLALRALQFLPPFLNVPNAVEPGRVSDSDFSFTARLAYDVSPQVNTYLSFATGYKAASVNLSRDSRPTAADLGTIVARGLAVPNLTSGSRFADAEDSTVFEAGLKGNWGVATVNVAVFKQIIKGFQSNIFTGTGFFLANAGKQSAFGIEFESTVKPVDPLTLFFSATYLDPKYDRFVLSAFGDLSGTKPAGVSPFSMTIGGTWDQPLGDGGDHLILRADYHYEAPFRLVEGLPNLVVKNPVTGQVLDVTAALAAARQFRQDINDVNASLTWAMASGLEVSVWGRNLLDDRTILQIFDSPAQLGSISGYPNQPRTYGVSARFRW